MSLYIPTHLRQFVLARANHRCEYCLFPQTFAANRFEPDHIISVQHGGHTEASNLAAACFHCNRNKGPNVGSFDPLTAILTPFFHPRLQHWHEHFELRDGEILHHRAAVGEGEDAGRVHLQENARRADRLSDFREFVCGEFPVHDVQHARGTVCNFAGD